MSATNTDSSIAKTNRFQLILFDIFRLVNLGLNAIILQDETADVMGK
jgi:hypothetical protein